MCFYICAHLPSIDFFFCFFFFKQKTAYEIMPSLVGSEMCIRDRYLTIADGLFVDTNMVTESQFYGHIVSVVNVLPGSILCKTLCGVGYYLGINISGSIVTVSYTHLTLPTIYSV